MNQQSQKPPSALYQFFAKLLIKWKFVKQVPLEIDHINQLIKPYLPAIFDISIPSGTGKLSILKADLEIPDDADLLVADVLCNFSVGMNQSVIYNTHISIQLSAKPVFDQQHRKIRFSDILITSIKLITDKDSVLKNTRTLISGFLPEPLRSIFSSTFVVSEAIMSSIGMNELLRYLALYLAGSKQKVFEYSRSEIEKKILNFAKSDDFSYQLDETDFEEKLFADFGKKVTIDDGKIIMVFHQ